MSDDEYYADSPYDEFEEMLWDADAGPSLADDLAQHASYSPVWQDNPTGELQAHHSDWEYYSDDYYDDDPAILKSNPASGSPSRAQNMVKLADKKGRKRKLDEFQDSVSRIASQSLTSAIQGTVWAKDEAPRITVFKSGQQERVALLTDWRKRFELESRPRKQVKRDESWANDLSLMDMGLTSVRDAPRALRDTGVDDNQDEEVEEEDLEDYEEAGGGVEENGTVAATDVSEIGDFIRQLLDHGKVDEAAKPPQVQDTSQETAHGNSHQISGRTNARIGSTIKTQGKPSRNVEDYIQEDHPVSSNQSKPGRVPRDTTDVLDVIEDTIDESLQPGRGYTKTSEQISNNSQGSSLETPEEVIKTSGRKRKVSVSSADSSTTTNSRPSRRAKRIASERVKEAVNPSIAGSQPTRKTRATRNTKK